MTNLKVGDRVRIITPCATLSNTPEHPDKITWEVPTSRQMGVIGLIGTIVYHDGDTIPFIKVKLAKHYWCSLYTGWEFRKVHIIKFDKKLNP